MRLVQDLDRNFVGIMSDLLYKPGEYLNNTLMTLIKDGKKLGKIAESTGVFCETALCP